jgi:hypothetical protein
VKTRIPVACSSEVNKKNNKNAQTGSKEACNVRKGVRTVLVEECNCLDDKRRDHAVLLRRVVQWLAKELTRA